MNRTELYNTLSDIIASFENGQKKQSIEQIEEHGYNEFIVDFYELMLPYEHVCMTTFVQILHTYSLSKYILKKQN